MHDYEKSKDFTSQLLKVIDNRKKVLEQEPIKKEIDSLINYVNRRSIWIYVLFLVSGGMLVASIPDFFSGRTTWIELGCLLIGIALAVLAYRFSCEEKRVRDKINILKERLYKKTGYRY
jgi:Tfp pilus assembly protein PilO